MFYKVRVSFEVRKSNDRGFKSTFYYAILWMVFSLLDKKEEIKDKILKISYYIEDSQHLHIDISLFWWESLKNFIYEVLGKTGKTYTLKNIPIVLKNIGFNFAPLTLNGISQALSNEKIYQRIRLSFLSPTVVRRQHKEILLPVPEVYLSNVLEKIQKKSFIKEWLGDNFGEVDTRQFKKWLNGNLLPQKFNLKTQIFELKNSKMVGVKGNISYRVWEASKQPLEYFKLLKLQSLLAPFLGLGSFTKLGLGNIDFKLYPFEVVKNG